MRTRPGPNQHSAVAFGRRVRPSLWAVALGRGERVGYQLSTMELRRCRGDFVATTATAIAMVTGTARTRPMAEGRVRVTSLAMSSVERRLRKGRA